MALKDLLQKMPAKTRVAIFVVILVILAGCFLYFIRIPMNTEIQTLRKDVAEKQAVIKQNDENIRRLDELKMEVRALHEQLARLKEKLPPETEESVLLR